MKASITVQDCRALLNSRVKNQSLISYLPLWKVLVKNRQKEIDAYTLIDELVLNTTGRIYDDNYS